MSNYVICQVVGALVLCFALLAFQANALAQTPSPTPVNPATRPPGEQVQPPTAKP